VITGDGSQLSVAVAVPVLDWKYRILAVHCDVGRAGNYRRGNIMNCNGLDAGTEITAVIGSLPGT
jgi:hypothetical protein